MTSEGEMKLLEIDKLKSHEEIIPEKLNSLIDEIKRDGVIKEPVIVDKETLVVLDGHHRVEALRKLGCRLIPVLLVNYFDPSIRVERWYPVVRGEIKGLEDIIRKWNELEVEYVRSVEEAIELVEKGKFQAAVIFKSVSKEDVIKIGLSGEKYPPKTTRHVIPNRPRIEVPLEELYPNEISRSGSLSKGK